MRLYCMVVQTHDCNFHSASEGWVAFVPKQVQIMSFWLIDFAYLPNGVFIIYWTTSFTHALNFQTTYINEEDWEILFLRLCSCDRDYGPVLVQSGMGAVQCTVSLQRRSALHYLPFLLHVQVATFRS